MGLRATAAADLKSIVENTADAGWDITITNPDGVVANVVGLTTDIALTIDPETGTPIIGRTASASVCISTVEPLVGLPKGISLSTSVPWLVTFDDINGNSIDYKVQQAMPDRALDVIVLILEAWDAS